MWEPDDIGEVIASRRITFTRAKRKQAVEIAIGCPVKGPERRDPWWCPVRIGAPIDVFQAVAGEDSLQALVLALEFLQTTLPTFARRRRGSVEWLGEHERLVFAGTEARMMGWESLARTLDGLRRAISHIERQPRPPKALLDDLRGLVARSGVGKRVW